MPSVVEYSLPLLVNSNLTKIRVLVGILFWHCPIALAAATACSVLPDRWFTPHVAVYASSLSLLGMLLLIWLGLILPFGLPVGFNALIDLGPLLPRRFKIFRMFTFGKLALFLSQFVSNFFACATPLM